MKLVTYYTPSHESLVKRLLASRLEEYTVVVRRGPQLGNGLFRQQGFHNTTLEKMRAVRAEATEDLVFTDADVVFLKPSLQQFLREAEGLDVVFQADDYDCCAGLFFMRSNARTLALLDDVIARMECTVGNDKLDDQSTLNEVLRDSPAHKELKVARLSPLFANPCTIGGRRWYHKQPLVVPAETIVFHANWIVGLARKHALLDVAEHGRVIQNVYDF